jgi:hypothetical protein
MIFTINVEVARMPIRELRIENRIKSAENVWRFGFTSDFSVKSSPMVNNVPRLELPLKPMSCEFRP